MRSADEEPNGDVPELLYHTLLTVTDYCDDTSGYTKSTYPLGMHASLPEAKSFAANALETLKYQPDDFKEYQVQTLERSESWKHGDGVIVYAKAPAGREFVVWIDTTNNIDELPKGGLDGRPLLPSGADQLHYVIQTCIHFDQERSGAQEVEIEGVYGRRDHALDAAKRAFAKKRSEYMQYDEQERTGSGEGWPFGEDVIVHAVAQTGEHYCIAVRTVGDTHRKYTQKDAKNK